MSGGEGNFERIDETDLILMIEDGRLILYEEYVVLHKNEPDLTRFLQDKFDRNEFVITRPPHFSFEEVMKSNKRKRNDSNTIVYEIEYPTSDDESDKTEYSTTETDSEKTEYSSDSD